MINQWKEFIILFLKIVGSYINLQFKSSFISSSHSYTKSNHGLFSCFLLVRISIFKSIIRLFFNYLYFLFLFCQHSISFKNKGTLFSKTLNGILKSRSTKGMEPSIREDIHELSASKGRNKA